MTNQLTNQLTTLCMVWLPVVALSGVSTLAFASPIQDWEYIQTGQSLTDAVKGVRAGDPWVDPVSGIGFVWVGNGCYTMGSLPKVEHREDDEGPTHEVCIAHPPGGFWLGRREVTQGEWRQVMRNNPAQFRKGDDYPVERVSWEGAETFLARLNRSYQGQMQFRLPTEAEWEYACRNQGLDVRYAGSGDPAQAGWSRQNSNGMTQRSGSRMVNRLGLFDMSGNVWEWVQDSYDGQAYRQHGRENPLYDSPGVYRVIRGGAWDTPPDAMRCSNRGSEAFSSRKSNIGLRIVAQFPVDRKQAKPVSLKDVPL